MRKLSELFLAVNSATPVPAARDVVRQHFTIRVNKADIRRETYNGRPHVVVTSYTLPDNVVMNGGLYTRDQIEANYKSLEGTLAPFGHPTLDGKHISARSPEALNSAHVGAWNRNVERVGSRIKLEKWIDEDFAKMTPNGQRLLKAIDGDEPIHTSVAAFVHRELTPNAEGYTWKAHIQGFDHDAILLDENGAATPDQGVGIGVNSGLSLAVNVADAKPLVVANSVLKHSYGDTRDLLNEAAKKRVGADSYAWVVDFDDTTAIVETSEGSKAIGYTVTAGVVTWANESIPVYSEQRWEVSAIVNKVLKTLGFGVNSGVSQALNPPKEAAPMTPEEIAAMLAKQAETIAANMAEQLKPITDRLAVVETTQTTLTETIATNANAALASKREVVAKVHGEVVANALSGDALEALYTKCLTASPLVNSGHGVPIVDNKTPSIDEHLG